MTTEEIAKRLVTYCLRADWTGAYDELYADNARSIEPYASAELQKEIIGLEDMRKIQKAEEIIEKIHGLEVSELLVAGNSIAFTMTMDCTMKRPSPGNSTGALCLQGQRWENCFRGVFYVSDGEY